MKPDTRLKVVNLWAGPGAGKSTTAAGLFALMKAKGHRVELVTEVAKDWTYDGDVRRLNNQLLILAQQYDRLDRLVGQVDYAVTDSPLPIGLVYTPPKWRNGALVRMVKEAWSHFDNVSVKVRRVKPYQQYGRSQTEGEAIVLDEKLDVVMRELAPAERRLQVDGDSKAPTAIYDRLKALNFIR